MCIINLVFCLSLISLFILYSLICHINMCLYVMFLASLSKDCSNLMHVYFCVRSCLHGDEVIGRGGGRRLGSWDPREDEKQCQLGGRHPRI